MLAVLLLLFAQATSPAESSRTDSMLAVGIAQYRDGDFETAVFTLDSAIRRLEAEPQRSRDRVKALLYLGAAYVGLDHEVAARGKFREALRLDPALPVDREEFPARAVEVLRSEQTKLKAAKGQNQRRWAAITIGAGAAAGMAAVAKHYLLPPPVPPSDIGLFALGRELIRAVSQLAVRGFARGDRPLTYAWDFGDGATASGESASHVYDREGTFAIRLTVRNEGGSASTTAEARVRSLSGPWAYSVPGVEDLATCTQTGARLDCTGAAANRDYLGSWYVLGSPHAVVDGEVRMRFRTYRCIGGEVGTSPTSGVIFGLNCDTDIGSSLPLRLR